MHHSPDGSELSPEQRRIRQSRYHGQMGYLDGRPAGLKYHDAKHVDEHGANVARVPDEAAEDHGKGEGDHHRAHHVPELLFRVAVDEDAEDRRHQGVDHLTCG